MAGTDFFIRPASGTSSSDWLRLPNADISVSISEESQEQFFMVEKVMIWLMKVQNQLFTLLRERWTLRITRKF